MTYEVVDGCPVPGQFAPILRPILDRSGASLQSCYRGADAEAILHKLGKQSQRQLYDGWVRRRPGYNPANPPGRSTHELRSDGVAYPGPVGRKLLYWQVGIDVDDAHVQAFIKEAAREGYTVTVTYPGSRSEYHHLNFRKAPVLKLPALKPGSTGARVVKLTRGLKKAGFIKTVRWNYDAETESAVRTFQKEFHQKVDGKWGAQSARQLAVVLRKLKKEG